MLHSVPDPADEPAPTLSAPARPKRPRPNRLSVELTARDSSFIEFVCQMNGATVPFVSAYLGLLSTDKRHVAGEPLSIRATQAVVRRWVKLGLVRTAQVEMGGHAWVYPTPSTVNEVLDFTPRPWKPTRTRAAHTLAQCEARLALVGPDPDPELWRSERALRFAAGAVKPGYLHVHDGWYRLLNGDWWAIEIELSLKRPVGTRLKKVVRESIESAGSTANGCAGLVYACETDRIRSEVAAVVEELRSPAGGTRSQQQLAVSQNATARRIPVEVIDLSQLTNFFADVERRAVS